MIEAVHGRRVAGEAWPVDVPEVTGRECLGKPASVESSPRPMSEICWYQNWPSLSEPDGADRHLQRARGSEGHPER